MWKGGGQAWGKLMGCGSLYIPKNVHRSCSHMCVNNNKKWHHAFTYMWYCSHTCDYMVCVHFWINKGSHIPSTFLGLAPYLSRGLYTPPPFLLDFTQSLSRLLGLTWTPLRLVPQPTPANCSLPVPFQWSPSGIQVVLRTQMTVQAAYLNIESMIFGHGLNSQTHMILQQSNC